MKKSLIISALVATGAMGAFAQGTVVFQDTGTGNVKIHIYQPQLADPTTPVSGNTSIDLPTGSTVYTGGLVGGSATGTGLGNGKDITVEIYAAPGNVVSSGLSALSPVSQYISTAGTKSAAAGLFLGQIFGTSNPDPGILNANASSGATVSIVAWYNAGTYVSPASPGNPYSTGVAHGNSPLIFVPGGNLGIGTGNAANLTGLESFSLVTTPEPSTIALGVIGAASFLIRRRK